MRTLYASKVIILIFGFLLSACGGDAGSGGSSSGSGSSGTTTTGAIVTSDAVLHTGTSTYDAAYPVINTALSVLDVNGDPIDNLDGGDFVLEGPGADNEDHYDVQKLDFLTHVNGNLVLMLDIGQSMAPRFTELLAAAQSLVTQAVALNLSIDVYTFSGDSTVALLGSAATAGQATTLNGLIAALTVQTGNTFFYQAISTVVAAQVGVNGVAYTHNPPGVPAAFVELMVIMSDGLDSPGTGNNAGEVTTAKDLRYWILSIPVTTDQTGVSNLEGISEFMITTASDGGTFSAAVDEAITTIDNYYNGFYLVDYQPTNQTDNTVNYSIKLFDNDSASINITYDATAFFSTTWLTAICCEVWAGPGQAADATATVTLNATAGNTMEFQVVQLWSNLADTGSNVTWTLSGNMTGVQSTTDPTVYTVTTTGTAGSGSLTVDVTGGTPSPWSTTIPITLN